MHDSTVFGRALNPVEIQQARYLDALVGFRTGSALRMEDDPGEQTGDKPDASATDKPDDKAGDQPDDSAKDKGYPANTPISAMTADQRAAYFEDKARTEENRRKELLKLTGGKYGDDLKAEMTELARLREERMSDAEKAVDEARKTVRAEVSQEYGPRMVRTAFDLLLGDMPEQERTDAIEVLDLSKFLTTDGNVDTAKVKAHAAAIAPAKDMGGSTRRDFGQGPRGNTGAKKTGVAAGADLFAARRKPTTTTP
jgi:hypothetical protein